MASITNLENYNSDQHFTPRWVFEKLNFEFDLDVAGSELSWVPSKAKYTVQDDGLVQRWFGIVWMNPPYSNPTPWVDRFIEHNNGIALLPVTRGRWWDRLWDSDALLVPTPYNFKFERPDGVKRDITFRTTFAALGNGKHILMASQLGKAR